MYRRLWLIVAMWLVVQQGQLWRYQESHRPGYSARPSTKRQGEVREQTRATRESYPPILPFDRPQDSSATFGTWCSGAFFYYLKFLGLLITGNYHSCQLPAFEEN